MSQKSDDSIERFFRKAVVQQDKTFMERDWHNMEKMLDVQAKSMTGERAVKMRTVVKATSLVVIIISLFLFGTESHTNSTDARMQAALGMVSQRIEVKTETPTDHLHEADLLCEDQLMDKAIAGSTGTKTFQALNAARNPVTLNRTPQLKANRLNETVSRETVSGQLNTQVISEVSGGATTLQTPVAADGFFSSTTKLSSVHENIVEPILEEVKLDSAKGFEVEDLLPQETGNNDESVDDESDELGKPKIVITGLVSPDFSTTSLTKYTKPSGVFGLLVGYRISKRFTFMTGITKSLKKYEGYGNEYSPPEGYWQNRTNGVVPDEVEGKCGIIEVPLLVQFDILQRSKSRIFISGGLSSYFMRSENYQYTFNDPNPGAADSWTAKEPSQYLFQIGHLSAGYDRMIGKKFSLGIEPFLKAPFQGIGWTDINLYTTGAYINLRYTILRTQH